MVQCVFGLEVLCGLAHSLFRRLVEVSCGEVLLGEGVNVATRAEGLVTGALDDDDVCKLGFLVFLHCETLALAIWEEWGRCKRTLNLSKIIAAIFPLSALNFSGLLSSIALTP